MLHAALLFKITFIHFFFARSGYGHGFGDDFVESLKKDKNLDLSVDEEYEDLRAELLAYHNVLKKMQPEPGRRSLITTPCWHLGGICVHYDLCRNGARFLTEVPGCKDKLHVCCFEWNKYKVRDLKEQGIDLLTYPWSQLTGTFGGKGVVDGKNPNKKKKPKKLSKAEKALEKANLPEWARSSNENDKSKDASTLAKKVKDNKHRKLKADHLRLKKKDDDLKILNDTDIVAILIPDE